MPPLFQEPIIDASKSLAYLRQIVEDAMVTYPEPWGYAADVEGNPEQGVRPGWIVGPMTGSGPSEIWWKPFTVDGYDGRPITDYDPDAEFTATFSPSVVKALLDIVEAAERHSDDEDSCITYPPCGDCRYCLLDAAFTRLRDVTS